jgi:hypothetical protein
MYVYTYICVLELHISLTNQLSEIADETDYHIQYVYICIYILRNKYEPTI